MFDKIKIIFNRFSLYVPWLSGTAAPLTRAQEERDFQEAHDLVRRLQDKAAEAGLTDEILDQLLRDEEEKS